MKKALFCLVVLLALSGCSSKEAPPMAGNPPPSSVRQESQPEPPASQEESQQESPLPPAEEPSAPEPAPEENLSSPQEENSPLLAWGVVSEDGLTYRNDALGLTVTLPSSSTGRPWCFMGKNPFSDVSSGMRLSIQMDSEEATDFATIQAMPHEDFEKIKNSDFFSGSYSDGWQNSRYAFTISYSRANPYEGTAEADDYQTMFKEIQRDLESGLSFCEPTA